ncbi:MAG: hypothetical protein ACFCD0_11480 [Gemmataceae bacterium]
MGHSILVIRAVYDWVGDSCFAKGRESCFPFEPGVPNPIVNRSMYHLLKHDKQYKNLGPDFFDRMQPERLKRYLVNRISLLGYDVHLQPKDHKQEAEEAQ